MRHNFITYFDWNYRLKGLALWESLEQHCPDYWLCILALDEATKNLLVSLNLPRVSVIAMSSFEDAKLLAAKRTRSLREYYWTCTPGWILFQFRTSPADSLNYVDADLFFFSNPEPVFQEIGASSLAVTPHDFPPRLKSFESNGIFNVGLVHVKRDATGLACMEEWEAQCLNWCYLRHDPNHPDWFCDQKYVDRWPAKYGAYAIQHKGANRAPWNMEKYAYSVKNGQVFVDDQPLAWWHFHGYETDHKMYPGTYVANRLQLEFVYKPYVEALRRAHGRIAAVA